MSKIRSKNTQPELITFAALRARGVYFQKHYQRAPGKPDIAKPRKKLAVFVDGDFWHGREIERVLRTHDESSPWVQKLRANMSRDIRQTQQLESLGWRVLRVWESDIRRMATRTETIDRIEAFLKSEADGARHSGGDAEK